MFRQTISLISRYSLVLILGLVTPIFAQSQGKAQPNDHPKVALVLSGGGAKGFAHIGVLKVLEEEGIPIDLIVGTSIGSLVGGIYSIGYTSAELEEFVKSLNWETVLTDEIPRAYLSSHDQLLKQRYIFSLPISGDIKLSLPQGLIRGQNVLNILCGLSANVPTEADFEKLPIPFACLATDLETGKEVVMKDGFLPTALFSSMAIPIAFQSSERDGRLLADGGLVNNFPTDVAKRMGADIIIGVDIQNDFYDRDNLKTINSVLGQLIGFFDQEKDSVNKSLCDLLIRPDISGYSMTSFNRAAVDTLIRKGEIAAESVRIQLQELKKKYQFESVVKSREFVKSERWHISDLNFSGNHPFGHDYLHKITNLETPGDFTTEEIKTAVDRIYGLGGFERIYFDLIDTEQGKVLNFNIKTKKVFTQNVGFKANTTDAAAILINTTRKNYTNLLGLLSFSAELSINPGITIVAESNRTKFPAVGLNLKGKYQNYNLYDKGDKISEANIFYTSGAAYAYQPIMNRLNLGLSLQEEYFMGDVFSNNNNYPVSSGKSDVFLTNAISYLTFDNMDDFYFPKKGTNMYAEFSVMTDFSAEHKFSSALLLKLRNVIPLASKTALLIDLHGRGILNSDYPQPKMTLVGGEPYSQYFNYHLPFVGLPAVNIADRFASIGLIGMRVQLADNHYASLMFNALLQSSEIVPLDNFSAIFGVGLKYAIKTFLGPLDMTLGYSGSSDKLSFSANFGYWF